MKFLREATAKGLQILPAELAMAGFPEAETAEVHVGEDAIVILKRRMTGMELIRAARRLPFTPRSVRRDTRGLRPSRNSSACRPPPRWL